MEKNNNRLAVQVDSLEVKLKKLIENYILLQEELKDSKNENEVLRSVIDQKNEELKNFQNQYKISKIVGAVANDKKLAAEYKLKINEYIKEVEKGLAYLNRI